MFSFFKKKKQGKSITLKIDGMHCTSCSMNIDAELEDTAGVLEASTNYAKGQAVVEYDDAQVDPKKIKAVISELGYTVKD